MRHFPTRLADMKLVCEECGCEAVAIALGWQGHLVDLDDDGQDEVAFFCLLCAQREFGHALEQWIASP